MLQAHAQTTGHAIVFRDRIIRSLLSSIETEPAMMRGRAMVYELDDNLLATQPWLNFHVRLQGDLDLVDRFARRADLMTVSTPALATAFARHNSSRSMGGGPYDVIRDGVDGLLARNKAQWREQLTRLATSPALREEMAGRARDASSPSTTSTSAWRSGPTRSAGPPTTPAGASQGRVVPGTPPLSMRRGQDQPRDGHERQRTLRSNDEG